MKAEQDGLTQPLIRSLASLGQHGSCPRNIQRQLMNRFCSHIHPDRLVKEITVPGMSITSMLFPHELFHEIRMKAPQQFIHRFGAVEAKCAAFWQALCQSPPGLEVFNRHPLKGTSSIALYHLFATWMRDPIVSRTIPPLASLCRRLWGLATKQKLCLCWPVG